jgi:hypothetical protein
MIKAIWGAKIVASLSVFAINYSREFDAVAPLTTTSSARSRANID